MTKKDIKKAKANLKAIDMPALTLDQGRFLLFALLDAESPMSAIGRRGVAKLASDSANESYEYSIVEHDRENHKESRYLRCHADALELVSIGLRRTLPNYEKSDAEIIRKLGIFSGQT